MKKDSFKRFMLNHVGYDLGFAVVVAFIAYAIIDRVPAAIWTGVVLLTVMSLATYFGFKKWKRNQ